jgi:hypothetical protein
MALIEMRDIGAEFERGAFEAAECVAKFLLPVFADAQPFEEVGRGEWEIAFLPENF